jgi:hypothetical protein
MTQDEIIDASQHINHMKIDVENYNKVFGRFLQIDGSGLVTGAIYLGNNYAKSNEYYGGYQGNYLKRIKALFPNAKDILHLYAGQVNDADLRGDKIDMNPQTKDTKYGDARELSKYIDKQYDLIVADPPYGEERLKEYQKRYGCKAESLNVKKVFREMHKATKNGGFVVWLDWQRPFYRGIEWKEAGAILYRGSTGHKDRSISIYKKVTSIPTETNGEA